MPRTKSPTKATPKATPTLSNARVRHSIKSALELSRAKHRQQKEFFERPLHTRLMTSPGSEFKGTRPVLKMMTSAQAKGLRVVAMTGRESESRGSFSTGEQFEIRGRDDRGWTIVALHKGQPTARICTGVEAMCLQVLEAQPGATP